MTIIIYKYLKIVEFKQWQNWDVKSYIEDNISSYYPIIQLKAVLQEINTKEKLKERPDEEFGILGVNNKIGIFDAYLEKGSKINQPYKVIENNQIAYNPYRVNVGSVGIKSDVQTYKYISNAYVVFGCDEEKLDPNFFLRLFKSDTFNKLVQNNTKGSVRQNLSFDLLSKMKIPLPSKDIQMELLNQYNKKLAIKEININKIKNLESKIETYLMDELGIEIVEKKRQDNGYKFLQFVEFKDLSRWGVEYLTKSVDKFEMKKFPLRIITDFIEINPKTIFPKENLSISFIPMECISDEFGEVKESRSGFIENSKGYTKFKENDLIWAKITPCMQNGKSAIVRDLVNNLGYGSTEFHVFRAKHGTNMKFFYHLFRTNYIKNEALSYFTGTAGQQRVPTSYFEGMKLPIPPLEIQNKIVAQIDLWKNEIKRLKLESEELESLAKREFEKAIFSKS